MSRRIPLETYSRRSVRLSSRRDHQRRRTAIVVASALVVVVVVGAYAVLRQPDATPKPARKSTPASAASTASAVASVAAASVQSTTPAAVVPSTPPTITVAGVGDMLFDRNVKKLIQAEGGDAPLAEVAPLLAAADVAVGNLETTLSDQGSRNPVKEPKYAFRGHPDAIEGLKLAGFDALSLANNHAMDYRWPAMQDTIARLDAAGIAHAGAGANTDAAWQPASIETSGGARVAYLAFSHIVPVGYLAQGDRPGIASGKTDLSLIDDAIRAAKKDHDYVIVSFHWGVEYEDNANGDQKMKAHRAIDAGADMVLAHHPHVIQGIEFYQGKMIAYSLGDFVFDHYSVKTGESFIVRADLGASGTPSADIVPVYLDGHGRPEYVKGDHARAILERLKRISSKYGTSVAIDGNTAEVRP